jgi:hypothetical protein
MLLVAVCGCSADGGNAGGDAAAEDSWEYGTGYVLEKAEGRLLIVSEKFEAGKSADDVLANGGVKAIWLAVKSEQFESAKVGDHVKITVVGAVAESYPEQGTGSIEPVK